MMDACIGQLWPTLAIVAATLLGPIFAVQAQKWLERRREVKSRKEWVFYMLMSNRRAQLHPDFVRALNTIDIAFNGGRESSRSKTENNVIRAWRDHHHILTVGPGQGADTAMMKTWHDNIEEKFTNLLECMAQDLNYSFDRETLRSGGYSTKGSADHENELTLIRQALVRMTKLEAAVPVLNVQVNADGEFEPIQFHGVR